MKFDTSGWGEFKLSDLFSVNSSNKIFHANKIKEIYDIEQENTYPYVVRSAVNNGIRGYINENEKFLNPANTLSFAQDTFSVFYQEKPYFTGNKVKVLIPKFENFNKIIALFIVANYQKSLIDFSWGTSSTTSDIEDIMIGLPTKNNEPDWEFMENTIKSTQNKMTKIIKAYELVKNGGGNSLNSLACPAYPQLDSQTRHFLQEALMQIATELMNDLPCKWKEFQLVDLFELHLAKGDLQPKKLQNGEIPLVSAGGANNGIVMYIKDGDGKSDKFDSNVITIDMFGKAFYQNKDFFAVSHGRVNILKPKFKLNFHIGLFFVSLFDKKLLDSFSFTKMCSQGRLQKETINLPIDPNGEPNFALMEKFIKNIEQEHSAKLLKFYEMLKANGGGGTFNLNAYKQYLSSNPNLTPLNTLQWREFKIGELFETFELKKLNPLDTREFRVKEKDEQHPIPAVVAKVGNNGIMYYVGKNDFETTKNKLVVIGDGAVASGLVYYQGQEFTILHNAYAIKLKYNHFETKHNYLFLACVLQKAIFDFFGYENKPTWNKVKECKLVLPILPSLRTSEADETIHNKGIDCHEPNGSRNDDFLENQNGQIAFEFMENFISAVQKEVIKSVVLWKQKRLNATKQVIAKHEC